MPRWLRSLGAIVAAGLLIFALYTANQASQSASDTARSNKHIIHQLRENARTTAVNNYKRAVGACASSSALRALLNDYDTIIGSAAAESTNAASREFALKLHNRTHAFTDDNPNCKNLPPRPSSYTGP